MNSPLPIQSVRLAVFSLAMVLIGAGWPQSLRGAVVTRGPYLQQGTPNSVVVRWRTDVATDSRVRYGAAPGSLTASSSSATVTTEHEITVGSLQPNRVYYYAVGTSTATLAGDDANHYFVTFPPAGTAVPTRIWILGDAGTQTASQRAVRDAYYNFTGARHTDLWLMLGDNAYDTGTDSEYQGAVFNTYQLMLRKSVLFSTRGNHESDSGGTGSTYYNIFTLPRSAESGGVASGTEAYYSFDFGNIHIVCLDAFGSNRATNGAMANWLRSDLAANMRDWIIAFWHHPPYSKGSHNSDTETELIQMRQNFLPILEDHGVDLVLAGHSHSYERSFLLDGHYGSSATLSQENIRDGGSGRTNDTGAYLKGTPGQASHEGAVYVVAGSSGQTSGGSLNHPAMYISLNNLGSVVLDIDGNRMDTRFVRENGAVADYFTIIKGQPGTEPPAAPSALTATPLSSTVMDLAWSDNSANESGFKIERSTDGLNFTEIGDVGANVTNGSDSGLTPGVTYHYRVKAYNLAGDSPYSNIASATTPALVPPAAPTSLTATAGKKKATLRWTQSASGNIVQNRIYRSTTSGGPYNLVATISATTTHNDNRLTSGTTYHYVVTAVDGNGLESAGSNQASATAK